MYSPEFRSALVKLRPLIGNLADAFWLSGLLDPDQQKDVRAVIQAMAAQSPDEGYIGRQMLLEPPPGDRAKGRYPLGTVIYAARPVCISGIMPDDLPQHVLAVGRSNAGKTNAGYLLAWNLLRAGKPFIVLDWQGNYRRLLNQPEGNDILLLHPVEDKSLHFNPLEPPPNLSDNQRESYLRDVVSAICTAYLPGRHLPSTRVVEYLFLKAMESLGADRGRLITFNDVQDYMKHHEADNRQKTSALDVLYQLTTGPIGRLMNCRAATTLIDILDRPAVLELDSMGSETDRKVFVRALLLWLYYYRLAEGKPKDLRHAMIVEEAYPLLLCRTDAEQSVQDWMLRRMKDLGQALVLLDRKPDLVLTPDLRDTAVIICLNLDRPEDVDIAAKALALPREKWNCIRSLPVGYAVLKFQGGWFRPFLLRFPRFPSLSHVRCSQTERHRCGDVSFQRAAVELYSALSEAIRALPVSAQQRNLMVDVANHPSSAVTERYARLGLNAFTGTKTKQRLVERGLIEQETTSRPGSVVTLRLTKSGQNRLKSRGTSGRGLT